LSAPEARGLDPITSPLLYPGEPPAAPAVLLLASELLEVTVRGPDPAAWSVASGTLDGLLERVGAAPMAARTPVVAVGSNASPAQLTRKFTNAGLVPSVLVAAVRVAGVAVGHSAHVSRPGYVPATPVPAPGRTSSLHVTWLDRAELAVLDATEPNYRRVRLSDAHPVRLPEGHPVRGAWIYASRHGHLVDGSGGAVPLAGQREVLALLIGRFPGLGVATPEEWIRAARDSGWRDRASALLRSSAAECSIR